MAKFAKEIEVTIGKISTISWIEIATSARHTATLTSNGYITSDQDVDLNTFADLERYIDRRRPKLGSLSYSQLIYTAALVDETKPIKRWKLHRKGMDSVARLQQEALCMDRAVEAAEAFDKAESQIDIGRLNALIDAYNSAIRFVSANKTLWKDQEDLVVKNGIRRLTNAEDELRLELINLGATPDLRTHSIGLLFDYKRSVTHDLVRAHGAELEEPGSRKRLLAAVNVGVSEPKAATPEVTCDPFIHGLHLQLYRYWAAIYNSIDTSKVEADINEYMLGIEGGLSCWDMQDLYGLFHNFKVASQLDMGKTPGRHQTQPEARKKIISYVERLLSKARGASGQVKSMEAVGLGEAVGQAVVDSAAADFKAYTDEKVARWMSKDTVTVGDDVQAEPKATEGSTEGYIDIDGALSALKKVVSGLFAGTLNTEQRKLVDEFRLHGSVHERLDDEGTIHTTIKAIFDHDGGYEGDIVDVTWHTAKHPWQMDDKAVSL